MQMLSRIFPLPFLFSLLACQEKAMAGMIPFKENAPSGFSFSGGWGIVLLASAMLLVLLLWRRKLGRSKQGAARWPGWFTLPQHHNDALKIVCSKHLMGGTSLHVIEWQGGRLLLSINAHGTTRLAEMTLPPEPVDASPPGVAEQA
jgi:hypothetical protein